MTGITHGNHMLSKSQLPCVSEHLLGGGYAAHGNLLFSVGSADHMC